MNSSNIVFEGGGRMPGFFSFLGILLVALISGASKADTCEFVLRCEHFGQSFGVRFKSTSGDCTENDMEVSFLRGDSQKALDLAKDWYLFTENISTTQKSVCRDEKGKSEFSAYAFDRKHIFLFVKSSGRPGYDPINVVVLDTEKGELSDVKRIGSSKNQYLALLKTKRGFKTRIIRDSLSLVKNVNCDCDAAFVEDWMEVSFSKGKVRTSWIR